MKNRCAVFGLMILAPLAAWPEDVCNVLYTGQVSALSADGPWLAAAGETEGKLFANTLPSSMLQRFGGGAAVSINGDLMAVGVPTEDGTGTVHLYDLAGDDWEPRQTLRVSGLRPGARFGASVALGATWLVVGAPEDGSAREGVAYVFSRNGDLKRLLHPGDGRLNDRFGASVAVHENTIVVGAPYADDLQVFYNFGAAYVFDAESGARTAKLQAAGSFRPGDLQFGTSVAIGKDRIVVGAPGDDPSGKESAGSAYLFIRNGGVWTKTDLVSDSSPSPGRQLGISVAIDRDRIAVGAIGDGAAYYFALNGTSAGRCGCGGHFGRSVALWNGIAFLSGPDGVRGCFTEPQEPAVKNTLSALCAEIEGSRRQESSLTYDFRLQGGPGQTGAIRGELTDALPANLPLLGASATSGQIHAGDSKATWKGTIGEGKTVEIRVQARVWMAAAGARLCNQARVSYDSDGDGVADTSVLSDDPSLPGAADACCFEVLPAAPVQGIPALSDVALAALALLLAALSVRRLRVRPATPSAGR